MQAEARVLYRLLNIGAIKAPLTAHVSSISVRGNQFLIFFMADPPSIDGTDQQTVNSYATLDNVPILLFKKEGLQYGLHTIKITVANATPPNICELDRFVYVCQSAAVWAEV